MHASMKGLEGHAFQPQSFFLTMNLKYTSKMQASNLLGWFYSYGVGLLLGSNYSQTPPFPTSNPLLACGT
jgi:hypothetical protein